MQILAGWLADRKRRAWIAAAAGGLVLLGADWWGRQARVWVVNTSAGPVVLVVDGRERMRLPPTSTETPGAGEGMRLSPGVHRVVVRGQAGAVDEMDISLSAGGSYLLAPGDTDQCFWIEHTAYGLAAPQLSPLRLLPREQRLWLIPDEVDAWFFPTPPPSDADRWSSGGTRTAVRQARCGFEPWR